MATILNTPSMNTIPAFDPAHVYSFTFIYAGNQAVKNRLVITDTDTLTVLFDHTQNGLRLSHELPSGTLEAGKSYLAQIQVFDADDNSSALSQPVMFYCFTTPEFYFGNIQNNMTISAANLELKLLYSQNESEPLQQYQYYVYEYDRSVMYYSGVFYSAENLNHTVYGLKNDTSYYIRAIGKTLHGMDLDTGYMQINVRYFTSPANMVLTVMNNKANGYITYYTGIKTIGYITGNDHYTIKDGAVSLRGNYLVYNDGFNIKGDFTVIIKADSLPMDSRFFVLRSRAYPYDLSLQLTEYNSAVQCRLRVPYSLGEYALYRSIPDLTYRINAGFVEFNKTLVLLLTREHGLFELTLNFEEE